MPVGIAGSQLARNWTAAAPAARHRPLRRADALGAVENPTREQQQAVADEIFTEIQRLHAALEARR